MQATRAISFGGRSACVRLWLETSPILPTCSNLKTPLRQIMPTWLGGACAWPQRECCRCGRLLVRRDRSFRIVTLGDVRRSTHIHTTTRQAHSTPASGTSSLPAGQTVPHDFGNPSLSGQVFVIDRGIQKSNALIHSCQDMHEHFNTAAT